MSAINATTKCEQIKCVVREKISKACQSKQQLNYENTIINNNNKTQIVVKERD